MGRQGFVAAVPAASKEIFRRARSRGGAPLQGVGATGGRVLGGTMSLTGSSPISGRGVCSSRAQGRLRKRSGVAMTTSSIAAALAVLKLDLAKGR